MTTPPKSPTWKFRMRVATLVCCTILGAFAVYLWNYPYKVNPPGPVDSAATPLKPMLRVGDGAEFQRAPGVCVCLSLVNSGASKLRLVDTLALEPLYDVKVSYHARDGPPTPAPMTVEHIAGSRRAAQGNKGFDSERDSIVELVPGAALTRVIPVAALFELQREGRYEVTVTYQPGALPWRDDEPLAALQVYEQSLSCSTSFELPLKKTAPAEQPKAAAPRVPAEAPPHDKGGR